MLVCFALKIFSKYINHITLKTFCKEIFFLELKLRFKANLKNRKTGQKQGTRYEVSVVSGRPEARVRTSGQSRVDF